MRKPTPDTTPAEGSAEPAPDEPLQRLGVVALRGQAGEERTAAEQFAGADPRGGHALHQLVRGVDGDLHDLLAVGLGGRARLLALPE